jgi:hypothetical protein
MRVEVRIPTHTLQRLLEGDTGALEYTYNQSVVLDGKPIGVLHDLVIEGQEDGLSGITLEVDLFK